MYKKEIFENAEQITEIRRYLHQHPELSGSEVNTARYIRQKLDEYGIEYQEAAKTGTIALIRGKNPGKTVLLRADIDALPIEEKAEVEFKSKNPGVMHACGHDIHTACVLYAGKILNDMRDELHGNIKLMFQPKEETDGGAKPMIDEGILENPKVDGAFALHVEPHEKCGYLQVKDGAVMASPDDFVIKIIGKGGHAATPHDCINPIIVGAKIVDELNSISTRYFSPQETCVVSVCSFVGGNCFNVIPNDVTILGTARSLDEKVREKLKEIIGEISENICRNFGATCEYVFNKNYPPTINNSEMNEIVIEASKKIPQIEGIVMPEKASMCGEDFAYVAKAVKASYFKLGVGNEKIDQPLHSPEFMADEKSLPIGTAILVQSALDFLKS